MSQNSVDIIPATKIGQLLDAYPDLEPVLIELSPAFKKLQNPVRCEKLVGFLKQIAS